MKIIVKAHPWKYVLIEQEHMWDEMVNGKPLMTATRKITMSPMERIEGLSTVIIDASTGCAEGVAQLYFATKNMMQLMVEIDEELSNHMENIASLVDVDDPADDDDDDDDADDTFEPVAPNDPLALIRKM